MPSAASQPAEYPRVQGMSSAALVCRGTDLRLGAHAGSRVDGLCMPAQSPGQGTSRLAYTHCCHLPVLSRPSHAVHRR